MDIRYSFKLASGKELRFELKLDPKSLALINVPAEPLPEWTRLSHKQCPSCPLSEGEHPRCPVARNLAPVIETFKDAISFSEAEISITTPAREYRRQAPLQTGISGLIGVLMATSGCPILDKLRPMVRTHLPFATSEETMYRAISMYLMAQYFLMQRGQKPDWELKDLRKIYEEVSHVNSHLVERLRTIEIQDASLNALVSLDCFAAITSGSIADKALPELEALFGAYLR